MRVSSFMQSESLRLIASRIGRDLDLGSREMATGRRADVGVALGGAIGRPTDARIEKAQLEAIDQSDTVAAARLEVGQASLAALSKGAEQLRSALIAAKVTPDSRDALIDSARGFLGAIVSTLGRDVAGVAIFGGRALDEPPVAAWDSTRVAGPAAAIRDAFVAEFGFDQDAAGVAAIDKTAMQSFLDGAFADRFAPAGWSADWSKASDETLTTTIAPGESVATTMSANDAAFRDLTRAVTMIADLGADKLNGGAFGALVDTALKALAPAGAALLTQQSRLGAAQNRLVAARDGMQALRGTLDTAIAGDEGADPYATAARVNDLRTRLETTYALTARLRELSLLKYL